MTHFNEMRELPNSIELRVIVCTDLNNGIGSDGKLLFDLPEDLAHFREKTESHAVIMGRKTWFSLPDAYRPLPYRTNIVLTRTPESFGRAQNVLTARTLTEALDLARSEGHAIAYAIGGESAYSAALNHPKLTEIDLSVVNVVADAIPDAFFPQLPRRLLQKAVVTDLRLEKPSIRNYRIVTKNE